MAEREGESKGGRPRIIESPEAFNRMADAYFNECKNTQSPVLLTGLVLSVGLSSKQSLYEYRDRPEFSDSVKKALLRVELEYEKDLKGGKNPTGSIFALKNFDWSDKSAVDHTSSDGSMSPKTSLDHLSVEALEKLADRLE